MCIYIYIHIHIYMKHIKPSHRPVCEYFNNVHCVHFIHLRKCAYVYETHILAQQTCSLAHACTCMHTHNKISCMAIQLLNLSPICVNTRMSRYGDVRKDHLHGISNSGGPNRVTI